MVVAIIVENPRQIKSLKTLLESQNILDKKQKIFENTLTTTVNNIDEFPEINQYCLSNNFKIFERITKNNTNNDTFLQNFLLSYIKSNNVIISSEIINELISHLPKRWTIYPPMLLIYNQDTFDSTIWEENFPNLQHFYTQLLKTCFAKDSIDRIAINKPIPLDLNVKRIPLNILPIHGDFGPEPNTQLINNPTEKDFEEAFWCHVNQQGIYQYWAPRYIMFSRGNIKEKIRILKTFESVANNDIIDLYSGIGYFTLCYLKKSCSRIFCWELNKWSCQGLIKGCIKNKIKYEYIENQETWTYNDKSIKIFIFNESNEMAPKRLAVLNDLNLSHVNLGLLPTSEPSWGITSEIIAKINHRNSTIVHIHENVHVKNFDSKTKEIELKLKEFLGNHYEVIFKHLEKIKTYAPDVWHACIDYEVVKESIQ